MNTISRPATESFDAETLALLEALEVPLPDFGDLDLDVAFGRPGDHRPRPRAPGRRAPPLRRAAAHHAAGRRVASGRGLTLPLRHRRVFGPGSPTRNRPQGGAG
ncbi:hypothetical protein [Streptomyces sp. NRRL F-5065]|uniref:hypothetical protein n=1 Tax=Streptomyces sp. NRRL F-5065 TaxID=1463855 RepID=UPI000B081E24|nr:hypothetical protein [Streptomyces sp. NRRL F-5065]